jgi:hypothetical protein
MCVCVCECMCLCVCVSVCDGREREMDRQILGSIERRQMYTRR